MRLGAHERGCGWTEECGIRPSCSDVGALGAVGHGHGVRRAVHEVRWELHDVWQVARPIAVVDAAGHDVVEVVVNVPADLDGLTVPDRVQVSPSVLVEVP